MQEQKTPTLATIFSEVLASLAFMFTEEDHVDLTEDESWLEITIGYDGPESGTLCLQCTRNFTILLASNLLGTNPDEIEAESAAEDAVKEFMNIVCGQFITAEFGTECVFSLTIPQIIELPQAPDLALNDGGNSSIMSVEGQPVQLIFLS